MRNDNRKAEIIAFAVFVAPLIYMGLKIAPYMSNGLISILNGFSKIFAQPFKITLCEDSLKAVLVFLLIFVLIFHQEDCQKLFVIFLNLQDFHFGYRQTWKFVLLSS